MSGFEWAALAAVVVWLTALSFVVVLLVRQLGIVSAWAEQHVARADEGLEIGTPVSEQALELAPRLDQELSYLVFLDAVCQPCREFALEAGDSAEMAAVIDKHYLAFAITGENRQSEQLARLLPAGVEVFRGREAKALTRDFQVNQSPCCYEVERGRITGRAVAGYGLVNFINLVQARETSDAAAYAGPASAVSTLTVRSAEATTGGE